MNEQEAINFLRNNTSLLVSSDKKLYQGVQGLQCIVRERKDKLIDPKRTFKPYKNEEGE